MDSAAPSEILAEEEIRKWVAEVQSGNEEAFARLVEAYARPLQALIYRMLLDWHETADVSQEAFVKAFRALPGYRHEGKFQAWLFQIGARLALDRLRKRQRRPGDSPSTGGGEALAELADADRGVERNEITRAIEEAVAGLPAEPRIAFIMAEYEGCSQREIAKTLGTSVKSVEMHLYRARQQLRESLRELI